MKCAIEECVNNDKDQAKNVDIKYHKFPKDPDLCNAWLESLHMAKFAAYYRRLICSNHFKEEDYYETKQGKRQLRPGAIPYLEDCYGPAALRTCKICLTMDAKMYQLKNGLEKMYKDVMGIEPRADHLNRLPMAICWECTARLNSAASFKSKALYCDELLHKHLLDNADLKILHIQKIHEGQTHLQSSLAVQQVFKFNNHDDEDDAPNTYIKAETIDIPNNEEMEVELESLLTDNITVKDERNNSIILVSNVPETECKTENDLADPISDVEEGDETNFVDNYDDVDYDKLTENIYIVDNLDSRNVSNTNLDSANTSMNEEKMETDNDAMYISQITDINNEETVINLTSDEEKPGDEGIPIQVQDETVMPVKKKKQIIDDDVIIWVKGRRPRKQSTYVPPCKPIDENIFSMIPLDPDDLRKEILARRDSDHYKNSPFKCEICYKGFPTEEKREIHVLKHSEKNGPFKCNICFVHVRRNRELNAHFSRQHMTEFICKLCPLKTRNREVALGHMKYHNGSMYNCPQCSLEFKKKTTLLNHLRLRHMSSFVCELCGYTFVSKHGVAAHKGLKHKLVDPDAEFTGPYCEECGVKFLTDKAYNRHLRLSSKHIAEDDPNRMSNDPTSKERRLGNSNIKTARRPAGRHRKTDNATTSDGQNTTSLSRQKIFQCDHCKKKFNIKQDLVGHMREHDDTRLNFTCEICGNQFTYSYNLTRHMFLHTGLKPFKCDNCEKTFSTSCELKAHVDYVHLKIPRPKRVRRKANKCEVQKLKR